MYQLYDEYVGINLKSKKFIDSLGDWGSILQDKHEEEQHEKNSY